MTSARDWTYRPIERWDGAKTTNRHSSPFKAPYSDTEAALERELRMLGASRVVVQIDVRESDFRLDGTLRVHASPSSPAIRLAFHSREHGDLTYQCDRFYRWQDNMRAIALGLEALRKVERYGIASRGEQYTGWKALGTGLAMGAGMSREEAAKMLADLANDAVGRIWTDSTWVLNEADCREAAYRALAKTHHPDVGGDPALFARITDARNVLAGAD